MLARVDGVQIAQVLRNLRDNALKYAPPGSPVEVAARQAPGEIRVTVADQGPGVAPEEQERIFERFYRRTASPDAGVTGSGLGLAICRGLVAARGGRIWVESDGTRGATFVFVLPAEEMALPASGTDDDAPDPGR